MASALKPPISSSPAASAVMRANKRRDTGPEPVLSELRAHRRRCRYGSVRTQGSSPTDSPSVPLVRYAALTSSINSRYREMNTSRRAANDAGVLSILK